MKPIEFAEQTCIYAKDQPEYMPLPVHKTTEGECTSCWALTLRERLKLLFTGRIYWTQLTFNHALQPIRPSIDSPFSKTSAEC